MSYFSEPYSCSKNKIKNELDLSNYAIKSDLQNAADVDASKFTKKTNLSNLNSDIDKLDIGKLQYNLVE